MRPIETAPKPEHKIAVTPEELDLTPEELEFEDDTEAQEIEALKAATTKQGFKVKPASEAPDFFKPEK